MDATVGTALRAARERAGWTREVLAARAGVSRAAIEQIEAGRRVDVRISTVGRLADALGVSIDQLAGRAPRVTSGAIHTAFLYSRSRDLLQAIDDVTAAASDADGAVLVVAPEDTLAALRSADRLDDERVDVGVAEQWASTVPAAAENYLGYLKRQHAAGCRRIWMFGATYGQRTPQDLDVWMRFEALANIIFAPYPVTVTCAYDAARLSKSTLRAVRETHPDVKGTAARGRGGSYVPPEEYLLRA